MIIPGCMCAHVHKFVVQGCTTVYKQKSQWRTWVVLFGTKVKTSVRERAKDACARQAHTLNEHVTESIQKKQKTETRTVVLVTATSSSLLPYYTR